MKFVITGRKIDITDGIREHIQDKLGKLGKFFTKDAEAFVTISVAKGRQTVEVTIHSGNLIIRAEETTKDLYSSIDLVIDVLERQVRKNKTRIEKKWHTAGFDYVGYDSESDEDQNGQESEFKVVKTKKFAYKPMSVDEAILQMNLLGHQFFVYNDDTTGNTQVVYRRKDGNYGLIDSSKKV